MYIPAWMIGCFIPSSLVKGVANDILGSLCEASSPYVEIESMMPSAGKSGCRWVRRRRNKGEKYRVSMDDAAEGGPWFGLQEAEEYRMKPQWPISDFERYY